MNLLTTKPNIESIASEECLSSGLKIKSFHKGLLITDDTVGKNDYDFCFSSWQLFNVLKTDFENFNGSLRNIVDWYCDSIRSEIIQSVWPMVYLTYSDNGYIPDNSKMQLIIENLKKRVSRIAKLATTEYPERNTLCKGLFIIESDDRCFWMSRTARFYGQRRMKQDPQAPSRSYLKVEEAFSIFGKSPSVSENVIDLGAAPGGWSYAASKRGAHVIAVDNGPLKKGALNSSLIKHVTNDAFLYRPERPAEWLFCDMVEDPYRVVKLIRNWLKNHWCRYAIVNFKYGFVNPFQILTFINSNEGFKDSAKTIICKHLFHDRDEITVMIEVG